MRVAKEKYIFYAKNANDGGRAEKKISLFIFHFAGKFTDMHRFLCVSLIATVYLCIVYKYIYLQTHHQHTHTPSQRVIVIVRVISMFISGVCFFLFNMQNAMRIRCDRLSQSFLQNSLEW